MAVVRNNSVDFVASTTEHRVYLRPSPPDRYTQDPLPPLLPHGTRLRWTPTEIGTMKQKRAFLSQSISISQLVNNAYSC